jgi:hypothetical protein
MLQIPTPMATPPPATHHARARPAAAATRPARRKATYEATIAIATESATRTG